MNAMSGIRELSATELDQVNGAVRISIGSFYIGIGEGDVLLTVGIKGVVNGTIFTDGGMCGHVGGNNVVDGSTGSNFLVGGTGNDPFFVDDRNAAGAIWSTVSGFHSGGKDELFWDDPVRLQCYSRHTLRA